MTALPWPNIDAVDLEHDFLYVEGVSACQLGDWNQDAEIIYREHFQHLQPVEVQAKVQLVVLWYSKHIRDTLCDANEEIRWNRRQDEKKYNSLFSITVSLGFLALLFLALLILSVL